MDFNLFMKMVFLLPSFHYFIKYIIFHLNIFSYFYLLYKSKVHAEALSVEPALGVKKRTRLSERSEGVCSF
jgi:hypothetical protein